MEDRDLTPAKKPKLKKKDILKFFRLVHAAALKAGNPYSMIEKAYFDYLQHALNSHVTKQKTNVLINVLISLRKQGFFNQHDLDINAIINDLKEDGARVKQAIKESKTKNAADKLIMNLKAIRRVMPVPLSANLLMAKGDYLATHNQLSEAIYEYNEAIKEIKYLQKIYFENIKKINQKLTPNFQIEAKVLAELHRKLANAYHDFAIATWHSGVSTTVRLDIVIPNLELGIHALKELVNKTGDDHMFLQTLFMHLAKALSQRASIYFSEEKFELAIEDYQAVLNIIHTHARLNELNKITAINLANVFLRYSSTRDIFHQIEYLNKAIQIFSSVPDKSTFEEEHLDNLFRQLSHVYFNLGIRERAYAQSLQYFHMAVEALDKITLKNSDDVLSLKNILDKIKFSAIKQTLSSSSTHDNFSS